MAPAPSRPPRIRGNEGPDLSTLEGQFEWFAGFATGPEARRRARKLVSEYALRDDMGDLLGTWQLSMLITFRNARERGAVALEPLTSVDGAIAYTFGAMRKKALGLLDHDAPILLDDDGGGLNDVFDGGQPAFGGRPDDEDPDRVLRASEFRREMQHAIHDQLAGGLRCPEGGDGKRCPPDRAAAIALVTVLRVTTWGELPRPTWGARLLGGGTTDEDEEMYEAMDLAAPGIIDVEERDDGASRVAGRSRRQKLKCGRCVRLLLERSLALGSPPNPEERERRG